MPWYGSVLLAVIPAIATGLFAWLIARSQYRAAVERLEKELAHEKDKDQRQRVRQVRGEPLEAFRREFACMAQKYTMLIKAVQLQHTHPGIDEETRKETLKDVSADWNSYYTSGNYERALFELIDQDIIEAAQHLWKQLAGAYVETQDGRSVFKELEEAKASITEVQRLISQRLQEL